LNDSFRIRLFFHRLIAHRHCASTPQLTVNTEFFEALLQLTELLIRLGCQLQHGSVMRHGAVEEAHDRCLGPLFVLLRTPLPDLNNILSHAAERLCTKNMNVTSTQQ
jgi:hypothetical protein